MQKSQRFTYLSTLKKFYLFTSSPGFLTPLHYLGIFKIEKLAEVFIC